MLTTMQSERLTAVGAGTPMGTLMRRYWHPVAASTDLSIQTPTKAVRLLGEDLVLFRDTSGRLGCIEPRCAHRKTNLLYGIPEPGGLRCAYHGWVYDVTGQCIEQPSEPAGSRFYEKIKLRSYRVQELRGLIFIYMGPDPAPLLPQWDVFVWASVSRRLNITLLPCNWLQCMDNSLDPVHLEWLHGYFGGWVQGGEQGPDARQEWIVRVTQGEGAAGGRGRHHLRIAFDRFENGIIKRRLVGDETEDDQFWRVGHPILFPNILRNGRNRKHNVQYRVPVDDTNTLIVHYEINSPEPGETAEPESDLLLETHPVYHDDGRLAATVTAQQDHLAWIAQGPITDRTTEHLGVTDVGILLYRKMLEEGMQIIEDGGDPMNVIRTPEQNQCIVLPQEYSWYPGFDEIGGPFKDLPQPHPEVDAKLAEAAP